MTVRAELMTELLQLPETDRADVAARLLASLDDDDVDEGCAEAWDDEIDRRAEADDEGAEFVDGAEAFREVRAEVDAHRR